jgi:polar amino acid transport system substrate-binding protein
LDDFSPVYLLIFLIITIIDLPVQSIENRRGNMKKIFAISSLLVFILRMISADEMTILTEDQPPLNFYDPLTGEMRGFAIELVEEVLLRIDSTASIEKMPWARAYMLLKDETRENTFLFAMARTPQRESTFKWIGPIAAKRASFYALNGSSIILNSLEEAKSSGIIGTKREDSKEQFLKKMGFTNLYAVETWDQALEMLYLERIDLIIYTDLDLPILAERIGLDKGEFESILDLYEYPIYIGVSKGTSDEIVALWQNALDSIKNDGTFEIILKKWSAYHNAAWVFEDGILKVEK